MTTLATRPGTALVVIDVQNGVVDGAFRRDEVVGNIDRLVRQARGAGVPVVWIQHADEELPAGSDQWAYVRELVRDDDEPLVHKHYGDSFEETGLEAVLAERGIGHLVVTGAQTDFCIRNTLHGALVRGYDATLVGDAHTTGDLTEYGAPGPSEVIAHTNLYWDNQRAPGRTGRTVATAEVRFDPVESG